VDTSDLDRYRPPAAAAAPPPPGAQQPAKADSSTPLDANGTLALGALHFAPLDLSNVKLTIAAKDKVLRIFPLKAQVYGGQYSGDITLDDRSSTPAVSLDEHLSGIDVGKLVAMESKKVHVTGRGNVNFKATGHGAGADAILKSLEGHFDTNVANGAVEGIDLGYELGRAEALLRRQDLPAVQNTKRTTFDALKLSAEITKGVAATKDLLISSAALKVTGQGTANLPTGALDLALLADTMKTTGNVPIQIPVKITGTLSDPTVRPDVEALAKGELKQKVKDVLQDKLKGLFGKP
jgi:AsmA protein